MKPQTDITHIWHRFHQELKGFIVNVVKSPSDADDILQEVFVKIIRNIDKVKEVKQLRPYLYGMVRNGISDFFRKKQHFSDETKIPEKWSEETAESLNTTIAECCIQPFIQQLTPKYKEALSLTVFENLPQKTLAKQLDISYSGAKSRVQRGKEKLKKIILDCCAYQSDVYGNLMEARNKDCDCS